VAFDAPGSREATVIVAGRTFRARRSAWLEVANSVLGGTFDARLSTELRLRRGLTYDAASDLAERRFGSVLKTQIDTLNAWAPDVARLTKNQIQALSKRPLDARELAARQNALIGQFGRQTETTADMADLLCDAAINGAGADDVRHYPTRIRSVTPEEARAAAGVFASASSLDVLIIGDIAQMPRLRALFPAVEVFSRRHPPPAALMPRPEPRPTGAARARSSAWR
jgi:zinc protease